ncbi:WD40-repeat-containing domain protein [Pyronema omphalodes]|nr:WD40-repeat-containing domain protein [Pyronema omphalodes]
MAMALSAARSGTLSTLASFLPRITLPAFAVPLAIHLNLPTLLPGIFESILRAVPKKKQSHSRKRMRQLAGKALQDVTALNKCAACGRTKRAHILCPYSHEFDIFGVAVTPKYVLTAAGDSSIKLWETGNPEHILAHEFRGAHPLGAHHIAVNRNTGTIAASVGYSGEIILWDLENLKQLHRLETKDQDNVKGVWAIALSPVGDRLFGVNCHGKIAIWDTANPQEALTTLSTKGSFGTALDVSPDGNLVASGHQNGDVFVFNTNTNKMHHCLHGLTTPIRSVKFSPGGKLLAVAGDSMTISLFDVASGDLVNNLTGHSAIVFSVAWNPVGDHVISGSVDGKVKVWSVDTFQCVATQNEASLGIYSVQTIPKGSGIGDGFIAVGANKSIYYYRESAGDQA